MAADRASEAFIPVMGEDGLVTAIMFLSNNSQPVAAQSKSNASLNKDTEPIPLRDLTVLLNYERQISDSRFHGQALLQSTTANPKMLQNIVQQLSHFHHEPSIKSVFGSPLPLLPTLTESCMSRDTHVHVFKAVSQHNRSAPPSTLIGIHPQALNDVKKLTVEQRDLIYHQCLAHDGCFKAIGLYNFFFELLPSDQKISIQVAGEDPIIVCPSANILFEARVREPYLRTICTIYSSFPRSSRTLITGCRPEEKHIFMAFPHPENAMKINVVDMTRMQYGEAGRGIYGETYFLGSFDNYMASMEKICGNFGPVTVNQLRRNGDPIEAVLDACAKRVWQRWNSRDVEGWCAYCGIGGRGLARCRGCRERKVWYCSKEHRVAGMSLHRHTCENRRV